MTDAPLQSHSWTGAIFAGGQSSRMGQSKEGVRLKDGRPMIEHVMDALWTVCARVVIVGTCRGYEIPENSRLIHLEDLHPGCGPLSGLEALLASGLADRYLVTSCDQPLLEEQTLQLLLAGDGGGLTFFRSTFGEALDPFPGIYPATLLPQVQQALAMKRYAIRELIQGQPVEWVSLPEFKRVCLANVNTPQVLAALPENPSMGDCGR